MLLRKLPLRSGGDLSANVENGIAPHCAGMEQCKLMYDSMFARGPYMRARKHGFTLIELLVVIAIIGLLASVVLASLSSARLKGRDARRLEDLSQIRTGLELYYSKHGHYPGGSSGSDRGCWVSNATSDLTCHPLAALILDSDMSSIPHDPGINAYVAGHTGSGAAQFYSYYSDGKDKYLLGAVQESKGFTGCTQSGNWSGGTATNYTYQYYLRTGV
jgi:prepilin-type N-terminal cleavage/methylation domain-containing protein